MKASEFKNEMFFEKMKERERHEVGDPYLMVKLKDKNHLIKSVTFKRNVITKMNGVEINMGESYVIETEE